MKQLLSISALILIVQTFSFGQVTNVYGNFNWINDHIYGYHYTSDLGSHIRQPAVLDTSVHVKRVVLDDSSAYSRVRYWLGGNASQRLRADLQRPFSKTWRFEFSLDRKSYPGWMDASFSRETDIYSSLKFDKGKGLTADFHVAFLYRDREMNGGLTGSDYSIEESQAGFSSLTSDVWFTDAFSRKSILNIGSALGHKWVRNNSSVSFNYLPQLQLDRFRYEDPSPDSSYLSKFRSDLLDDEALVDSNRLLTLTNEGWLDVRVGNDSTMHKKISGGVGHSYFEYYSNGVVDNSNNVYAKGRVSLDGDIMNLIMKAKYYFLGLNKNDIRVDFFVDYTLYQYSDSTTTRTLSLGLDGEFRSNNPSLVYMRYASSISAFRGNYNKMSVLFMEPFGLYSASRFSLKLAVKYQSVGNWIYFDDRLTANQYNGTLDLIAPNLGISYKGTNVRFEIKGTHQIHNATTTYSLPEWIGELDLGIRFPMFKKKVYLTGGVEGWYFSEYYARGYMPLLDVMYVQSTQLFGNYLQLNPYVMANIQTVDVKLGFINANYGLTSDNPLVGPVYPSVPRMIQLSIDWNFKN